MAEDNDVSMRRSFDELYLTAGEIETLGMIVNALGVTGSQLILRHRPELYLHAQANLQKCRGEHEELLKRLDHAARRCLLAAAFLGHCIAAHNHQPRAAVAPHEHKRLN